VFDPDWRYGYAEANFGEVNVYSLVFGSVPEGNEGDTLCVALIFNSLDEINSMVIDSMFQGADPDIGDSPAMDIRTQSVSDDGKGLFVVATGTRVLNLATVVTTAYPGPGGLDWAYGFGNYPPDTLGEVLVNEERVHADGVTSLTVDAAGSGSFFGVVFSDSSFSSPGVTGVTAYGDGELETFTAGTSSSESETPTADYTYEMTGWTYKTGASDAEFNVTGENIHNVVVLGNG
jgi:hypothetical protein